jgi:prepilin-type N-terminal cleavage/methylation domain-containing protein
MYSSSPIRIVNRSQRGLSLLESSVALSLIAIIMAGVVFLFNSAGQSAKSSEAARQVSNLRSIITSLYVSKNNYSGLQDTTILIADRIPDDLYTNNAGPSKIQGSIGDVWGFSPLSIGCASCNNGFQISVTPMRASYCKDFASKAPEVGVKSFSISNSAGSSSITISEPFPISDIIAACDAHSESSIQWRFLK